MDLTGDGNVDSEITDAIDTTGDGKADTLVVKSGNDLVHLSVIMDNPQAWPDVPCLSAWCRTVALSQGFEHFIGACCDC